MRAARQRDTIAAHVFGLSDESVNVRNRWRFLIAAVVWFTLGGFTTILHIFTLTESMHRLVVVVLSFLKYLPLLWVVYDVARQHAAHYLDDIFELDDEALAADFIEEVAFGYGHEYITINEGRISADDERSPIILVGGPGQIQVNLGSAALLEKLDGEPEVIYARGEPWTLGRFERIREIGKHDEVGKREYAVINLRDQFVSGLSVKARTRDGIPIEALDIKLMFSIKRPYRRRGAKQENDPYPFDEKALYDLVYKQITVTPPPNIPGVTFPWDTTVIPLVATELEKLICSHDLSDLLASIGQKELELINDNEKTVEQMRVEMTGAQTAAHKVGESRTRNVESRPNLTKKFIENADFQKKASELGITIEWIDIGTWQVASEIVNDKLKAGWSLLRENTKRQKNIERMTKKYQDDELLGLINQVVIANFEKNSTPFKFTEKELQKARELKTLFDNNPNFNIGAYLDKLVNPESANKRPPLETARDLLSAFRRELIAARDLIQKEKPDSELDIQAEIARIDKALRDIAVHVPYNSQ